jgi:DNA-binding NtrC family response regulator
MRILLVDDEPGLRMTLAANFELDGFEVVEADSGEMALDLAKEGNFDVVLTDVRMPGISGVELFKRLRPLRPNLPVILMTAFALEDLIRSALDDGAFTVLPKPFDFTHAAKTLQRAARGPAVLVVDDSQADADAMGEMLKSSGLAVSIVYDGNAALEKVKQGAVDVCVVDMIMPGLTGPQLAQELRKLHEHVSLIGVSGQANDETMRRFASHGTTWFMRKPFQPTDLVRLIAKVRGEKTTTRS